MGDGSFSDKLSIETPEQIRLEFPLAGIGSRFLALAFDSLLQFLAAIALFVLAVVVGMAVDVEAERAGGVWVAAVLLLLLFLLQFGYYTFFEAIWQGQTPGKRYQYLRVIKDTGQPITVYDAVARNLLRIVDSLPGFYAVGIVSVLLSSQNKRLGDYVGGTVVVHEKPLEGHVPDSFRYAEPGPASGYEVRRLSPQEFQLLEAYLVRRSQLTPEVRGQMARQIIQQLAPTLEISPDDQRHPEPLLERLATEYRNLARFR